MPAFVAPSTWGATLAPKMQPHDALPSTSPHIQHDDDGCGRERPGIPHHRGPAWTLCWQGLGSGLGTSVAGRGQSKGSIKGERDDGPLWDMGHCPSDTCWVCLASRCAPFSTRAEAPQSGSWTRWRHRADPASRIARVQALSGRLGLHPGPFAGRLRGEDPSLETGSLLGVQLPRPALFCSTCQDHKALR